jgi:hypothetical protein
VGGGGKFLSSSMRVAMVTEGFSPCELGLHVTIGPSKRNRGELQVAQLDAGAKLAFDGTRVAYQL